MATDYRIYFRKAENLSAICDIEYCYMLVVMVLECCRMFDEVHMYSFNHVVL